MFKLSVFVTVLCMAAAPVIATEQRPRTFSEKQEEVLAHHPKVLAFLYHMTRDGLSFEEMAEKYHLASTSEYYSFLVENELIESLEDGQFEFLFENPYGAWRLKESLVSLREPGLQRLQERIKDRPANFSGASYPVWLCNTYRLSPEEYEQYKAELLQITKKYTDLSEQNLFEERPHQVIWSMQLADTIDPETADSSHLLFGEVEEF